jgi:4-aminobutyrate aminotransferase-like enzyme/Ser/Thr protein kinase RdoA (MazF antagonist)
MSILTSPPPSFTLDQIAEIARDLYGLTGQISPLDSERDQNVKLVEADGGTWILKIANVLEEPVRLEFQCRLLQHLAVIDPTLPIPHIRPALSGAMLAEVEGRDGVRHLVRVVGWLQGEVFAKAEKTPQLLESLGANLGRIDAALQSFGHAGAMCDLDWDIRRAGQSRQRLDHLTDAADRKLVSGLLDRFDAVVAPRLARARLAIIHNDANDYNLLVDAAGTRLTGIIDFGDAMQSALIGELAIACAYAILDSRQPLVDAGRIAAAYHRHMPLREDEIDLLHDLIIMRLVTSVTMSASRRDRAADNAYLAISEAPAWNLLRRLAAVDPIIATGLLRKACGFEAAPGAKRIRDWIHLHRPNFDAVFDRHPALERKGLVPLGDAGDPIAIASAAREPQQAQDLWLSYAAAHGIDLGIGPWCEERSIYTTEAFASRLVEGQRRTLHIGLDLFVAAGTPVRAPLAGKVVDFYLTNLPLDYGCAVLLEHEPEPGLRFYSLWGHLAAKTASGLKIGDWIAAGQVFAWIGDTHENGNWLPHLHLQLVSYRPRSADDVIGAGESVFRDVWADLFPDPSDLAGLPPETFRRSGRSSEAIVNARRRQLLPNLSISYRQPLKIVRGEGAWLIDDTGRAYLDCYNNVAHLGHAHPEVVEVLARQAALLNTNTRYLHDTIIDYADALTATLPKHLQVCGFVCTGSEANDLALRMARAHTGQRDMVVLDWAYHGHLSSLIEISPYKYKRKGGEGKPAHIWEAMLPDSYRAPSDWQREDYARHFAQSVRDQLAAMQDAGRKPAGFIAESMPSVGGQIFLPDGYLAEVYRDIRAAGGVVIADEVQVGFGRIGSHMWGFETQGVEPDIVTMGKPIGNGHPLAALVTTTEIAKSFANGMEYFNTFGGNAVSCAVGLKVLEILQRDHLQENARRLGEDLLTRMRRLAERHPEIGDVRGSGLFLGLDLVEDRVSKKPATERAGRIVQKARELGVLMGTDGPYDNVIKLRPAMIFSQANADHLMQVLETAFVEA